MEIYDQLLRFSLFQGMSHADLMEVVTHTKLGFMKLQQGKHLVKEGDSCTHLTFLTHGSLQCETLSDDGGCRVVETVKAPYIVQPDRLFGLSQRYSSSFKADSPCNLITIDKQEVLLLLETQLVFRINLLNLLATEIQRLGHHPWQSATQTLRAALIRFFIQHTLRPAGAKTFHILMTRLGQEMRCTRQEISRELNQMQAESLLVLHRGRIEIPMLERLLM